jgi:cation transport ATPase
MKRSGAVESLSGGVKEQTSYPATPPPSHPITSVSALLARTDDERLREYKYRFSQAAVFGLPVIALQVWGRALGGPESDRWVGILQALLAGWVVYVGAAGMLFEGLILLPRRVTPDLFAAALAVGTYLFSLTSVLHVLVAGRLWYRPLLFHVSVLVVAIWTGIQWYRWARRSSRDEMRRSQGVQVPLG